MAASFKNLTGAALSLTVDGQEYNGQISSYQLFEEEKDKGLVTFTAQSGAQAKLKVALVQSLESKSLHQILFDNPGRKNVSFILAPSGDTTPAPDNPIFEGTLHFPLLRPQIGMEAKSEGETVEVEFIIADYKKKTSAGMA